MTNRFRKALATVLAVPATVFVMMIRLYQIVLSPDHSWLRHLYPYGYCRHEPTCSAYAIEALKHSPLPVALWRIIKRILSCNPWKKTTDERLRVAVAKALESERK
jgi:putative membrane protein insertion efficiency factor